MKYRACILVLCILIGCTARTDAGEIGIYANPDCSGCRSDLPLGGVDTLYVGIQNDNDPPVFCGQPLCGAGFRINGLPSNWVVLDARPASEAYFVYGQPFGDEGVYVAIPCSSAACIPLYTIVLKSFEPHADVHLRIVGGTPCSNYGVCSYILTSDVPCDPTCQCYPGGEIVLNPVQDPCTVGIASRSWSSLRLLYR
jgi:hypothetical protein